MSASTGSVTQSASPVSSGEPLALDRRRDSSTASAIAVVNHTLVVVLAIAALVAALLTLKLVVMSALIGLGIGVLLAPPLQGFQRRFHLPKAAGAAVVLLVTVLAVGGVGYGIFYIADAQITSLSERMPQLIERLQAITNGVAARYPWIGDRAESFNVADTARTVGEKLFLGAWSSFGLLGGLVFAFVIGLYTAVESETYYRAALQSLPSRHREAAASFLQESARTLRNWFRAQLTDMAIIGSLTAVGLWIVGADYWLLFGLLTGLLGIIPYVGIAIVVTFSGLVTLASDPSRLPWVLGVFVATQQLEGHLILPLVMSGRASLPAVPLLVFMLVLGSWGGLLGVLMAPPVFALLLLAYKRFYLPRMERDRPPPQAASA
ncbi:MULTISPECIES: AI-2E family transporter [Hydrocarboniphaga]|jgi:predicted PurR-regulated permease PerM|uniref:AI-2E family transporter n=1 Tax=Hydrocarboniphaga TaxID=243627 RepID=UPI002ABC82B7|nr:AI-2E family transporter [Hydrocarboniphaga sp.]MDZ4081116.1 AI-2E family transporter [Hydrocarboniphaga sp.]